MNHDVSSVQTHFCITLALIDICAVAVTVYTELLIRTITLRHFKRLKGMLHGEVLFQIDGLVFSV